MATKKPTAKRAKKNPEPRVVQRVRLPEWKWEEIGKRILAGEVKARLAEEYGVSRTAISDRFSGRLDKIKTVADQVISAEENFLRLTNSEQMLTNTLIDQRRAISRAMSSAAVHSANTSHRLAALANQQAQMINDADPMSDADRIKTVVMLQEGSNRAGSMPITMITAIKKGADPVEKQVFESEYLKEIQKDFER